MARQNELPPSLPPIGSTREVAAAYCSFSVGKFLELVDRGLMPKPKRVDDMVRWDLEEVRLAFKALPDDGEIRAQDDTWNDVNAS
jgi:predicted DNA-binding transcriptional regulator AlpA